MDKYITLNMIGGVIPVVDLSGFSVDLDKDSVDGEVVKVIAKEVYKAFSQIGFVYIMNHGIKEELVSNSNTLSAYMI